MFYHQNVKDYKSISICIGYENKKKIIIKNPSAFVDTNPFISFVENIFHTLMKILLGIYIIEHIYIALVYI